MYSKECIESFLKNQGRLYDEPVAETLEEAEEFLEDCMAVEVRNIKEVREYLDEAGADVSGMSDEELKEACEVFPLPSGGYLIVEG
ncbi:glyoxalase [Blautia sp. MSJ-19]|uniref:glyoxalase n=1 Tax=Blautia sp. MSJ-19 TaxID=2841517 RepID=UPI001C0F25AC|nr:glyoxalase [Blautia sp. MSJ-19]MBU5479930.1 glyoxalase [Blautia sp. MSJ-19]